MDNFLYAIPTMKCNLDCDHCFIANTPEEYDREKFLSELNSFDGEILIFGGEPTSNRERLFDIVELNLRDGKSKITSISTNLLILDDRLVNFYKTLNHVSTSWNPHRFTDSQYQIWLNNLTKLAVNDIPFTIMVTMTDDLLSLSAEEFLDIAKNWITTKTDEIKFEHYVGEVTEDYFKIADKWLCELYKKWNLNTSLEIRDRVHHWNYNCDNIYTLFPDGRIVNECPHCSKRVVPVECYSCERADKCRPCRLQPYCSFPKEFHKLVISHEKICKIKDDVEVR